MKTKAIELRKATRAIYDALRSVPRWKSLDVSNEPALPLNDSVINRQLVLHRKLEREAVLNAFPSIGKRWDSVLAKWNASEGGDIITLANRLAKLALD